MLELVGLGSPLLVVLIQLTVGILDGSLLLFDFAGLALQLDPGRGQLVSKLDDKHVRDELEKRDKNFDKRT